tara:strand:+ start:575 stop:1030 length:456 start_codon:yes stop_codon:yes gene_type:complete
MTFIELNSIYEYSISNLLNFEKIELNKLQMGTSLTFLRCEQFVDGFDCNTELIKLMNTFFGDLGVITQTGLVKQYKHLKKKIVDEKSIAMILVGINTKDILINNYTDINYNNIKLTISSICRILLREHFTADEIDTCCRESPNLDIYFNNI